MPAKAPAAVEAPRDTELERVKTLARMLDGYFIDPLIGLFLPGAGDVIGSMLGIYIVSIAARRKVSPVIIARMLMNLAADASIGAWRAPLAAPFGWPKARAFAVICSGFHAAPRHKSD